MFEIVENVGIKHRERIYTLYKKKVAVIGTAQDSKEVYIIKLVEQGSTLSAIIINLLNGVPELQIRPIYITSCRFVFGYVAFQYTQYSWYILLNEKSVTEKCQIDKVVCWQIQFQNAVISENTI